MAIGSLNVCLSHPVGGLGEECLKTCLKQTSTRSLPRRCVPNPGIVSLPFRGKRKTRTGSGPRSAQRALAHGGSAASREKRRTLLSTKAGCTSSLTCRANGVLYGINLQCGYISCSAVEAIIIGFLSLLGFGLRRQRWDMCFVPSRGQVACTRDSLVKKHAQNPYK